MEARRRRGRGTGSSASSEDEEYDKEGTADRGVDAVGSSGIQ